MSAGMNRKTRAVLIIMGFLLLSVITAGCTENNSKPLKVTDGKYTRTLWEDDTGRGVWISKILITEDNVTCYVVDVYEGGGISCLRNVAGQ